MGELNEHEIFQVIEGFSPEQKLLLLDYLKIDLIRSPRDLTVSTLAEIAENRFSDGVCCVHCGNRDTRRFGFFRKRQRYQCKNCKKTFTVLTNTPLHSSKKPEKWGRFLECLLENYSCQKCADLLDVHISTVFAWRHKALNALCRHQEPRLQGVVETDVTYVLFSNKGKRNPENKSRKRGGKAKKPGISQEQACILVARDRNKTTVCQLASYGRIHSETIDAILSPRLGSHVILCSDGETPFLTFCTKNNLRHEVINAHDKRRVKDGVYHIQNVNAVHSRYKNWIGRFQGVATKYTDNYLAWFNFLERISGLSQRKQLKQLLLAVTKPITKIRGYNLRLFYDLLLLDISA